MNNHFINQAKLKRFPRAHLSPGEENLQRASAANESRQSRRPAKSRHDSQSRSRMSEDRPV